MTPPYRFTLSRSAAALLSLLFTFNVLSLAQDLSLPGGLRATQVSSNTGKRGFHQQVSDAFNSSAASLQLPRFLAHREYAAANGPQNIAVGDLNGDGIADLVVPNGNTSNVSVLLGNRDGSFQPFALFTAGALPFHVAIADFNGDGKNDVAVTIISGVSILLGDGRGNLGALTVLASGTSPARLAVGDFNGDHKMDLAVTNLGSNDVSILLGRGDGTFAPAVNISVGMGPAGIAAGDFNHDGKVDLAVANSGTALDHNQGPNPNTVQILLGDGQGGFSPASVIPVQKTPDVILVTDVNKDNKQDLAVSSASGFVSELLGNGNGSFQQPRAFKIAPTANNMAAADFNGDGNVDIAVTVSNLTIAQNLTNIITLFGDGTGNFRAVDTPSGRDPSAVVTGDFNHDGKADYITANIDSNTVAVVLGMGNGKFFDAGAGIPDRTIFSNSTIAADFNNDGVLDLAVANTGIIGEFGNNVSVLLGNKSGGFEASGSFATGTQPAAIAAADLDHDGILDLVVGDFGAGVGGGDVSVLLGKGNGAFLKASHFSSGLGSPVSLAVADFNHDGNLDAVLTDNGTFVNGISLLPGNGNGGFANSKTIVAGGDRLSHITAADFNHDGKADIAYYDLDSGNVLVQLGNGDGTFNPATIAVSLGIFGTSFTVADFNHDGILDMAAEDSGEVVVLLGDGTGKFNVTAVVLEGTESGFAFVPSLLVGDFNGDGLLDIVAPDGFGETVSFLPGNGDGTFGTSTLFQGALTDSAAVVDFAGRQPSIAMASGDGTLRLLRNLTTQKQ
jgi:hypothetical protein